MAKVEPIMLAADPTESEDFDASAAAMDRGQRARMIRRTRTKLGLSQVEFAAKFHVPVGTLRDWEQARATAPDFAVAYISVIDRHPDMWRRHFARKPLRPARGARIRFSCQPVMS